MTGRNAEGEGPSPSRFETLDALRGVCALAVAFLHVPLMHPLRQAVWFDHIQFAVDIFFVLSGFVLLHAYGDRLGGPAEGLHFLRTRFWRLWPLHAATLALFVAVDCARLAVMTHQTGLPDASPPFGPGHRPVEILTHLLFLQDFLTFGELSWNFPSWSIAVEFYASIGLAGVVLLAGPRALWAFAGAALLAGSALYALSPDTLFVIQDWGILRCLFGLFVGCLAYGLRGALRVPERFATAAEASALGAVLAIVVLLPEGGWAYGAPLAFGAVIALFSHQRGSISALARRPLWQRLGRWSFAIYLTHLPVFLLMRIALHLGAQRGWVRLDRLDAGMMDLGSPGLNLLVACVAVGLTIPLAALVHRYIERPAAALGGRPRPASERPGWPGLPEGARG